ncbi:MAG: chemotaxis protein CheW [Bacillota bacterium]|jgi:purine-binding chemotaxis protein CheW|nr:chemotaxis protein CheW [Bacillota bacterium]MDD3298371.1 chemotaxis protein CheW [Bacillota bacterium]MDD3851997.1 chemotaxis protein CheW [Bacillota bacterium]MDD4707556.1 chemotaxis protein CheW [Bacillota bacterium]
MSENQLVVFRLGGEEYGIDILAVKEIIRCRKTVKLPECPDFVEGIINYRDSIVPILDLNKRFNLGGKKTGDSTRVIITSIGGIKGRQVGFVVDQVEEVLRLDTECIEEPPETVVQGMDRQFIRGVGKLEGRLIIVLDIEKVLSDTEKANLREISG